MDAYYLELFRGSRWRPGMARPEEFYTTCIYLPGIGLLRGEPTILCGETAQFSFSEASNLDDKIMAATVLGRDVEGIVNVKKISIPDKVGHEIAQAARQMETARKTIGQNVYDHFQAAKPMLAYEAQTRGVHVN